MMGPQHRALAPWLLTRATAHRHCHTCDTHRTGKRVGDDAVEAAQQIEAIFGEVGLHETVIGRS